MFNPGLFLPSRDHLAISGNIFVVNNPKRGATGHTVGGGKGCERHPTNNKNWPVSVYQMLVVGLVRQVSDVDWELCFITRTVFLKVWLPEHQVSGCWWEWVWSGSTGSLVPYCYLFFYLHSSCTYSIGVGFYLVFCVHSLMSSAKQEPWTPPPPTVLWSLQPFLLLFSPIP